MKAQGLEGKVEVCGTGCMGLCSRGPLVRSARDGELYGDLDAGDAAALVRSAPRRPGAAGHAPHRHDRRPSSPSRRRSCWPTAARWIPEKLADYIAAGGYQALAHAITEMTPQEVIEEIKASGLARARRRGLLHRPQVGTGGRASRRRPKYVVCNADEGDPGAFMDRSVLEGDPHRVLEGMALAGYAVGAQQGYIYVRGEYALAIQRLQTAIKQAEREKLLGNRVLETGFQFRVDIRIGAGAFVCGEETALIASIEGKRGQPRQRPPYPPESGLWGQADADQQRRDLRQRRRHHLARGANGSPRSAPRPARAPRSSRWPAGSRTPA